MSIAIERIVVQTTTKEKKVIAAKAKRLGLNVSELMRRGATDYSPADETAEIEALADAARSAAENSGTAIDDALTFIDASNARIAKLEARRKAA